jgi:hypothetical protein
MTSRECQERARQCREAAAEGGADVDVDELLQAAQTWDTLAEHVEQSALFPSIKPN